MLEKPISAKDISLIHFQDIEMHSVEKQFRNWRDEHPNALIYDITYNTHMAPVTRSDDGKMFQLYTITVIYTEVSKAESKTPKIKSFELKQV